MIAPMAIRQTFFLFAFVVGIQAQGPTGPILSTIDKEALDPTCKACDDFYQYAIGGWHARNPIPSSKERWGKRWAAADGNREVLQSILNEVSGRSDLKPGSEERKVSNFYAACMDEATINKNGSRPLRPFLDRIGKTKTKDEFLGLMREFASEAAGGLLFGITPRADSENPRMTVAGIGPVPLGLPDREYYSQQDGRSAETRKQYLKLLTTLFTLAEMPDPAARAQTVLALETKLAEPRMSRVELRNPLATNNRMSWAEAQKLAPAFDLQKQKEALGIGSYDGIVIVSQPKFQQALERLWTETPLADWKLLAEVAWLRQSAPALSKPFADASYEFYSAWLQGRKEQDPRWKQCADATDAGLADPLGKLYVAKMFPPAAKAKMQEMVGNLRLALQENIRGLEWMTEATKARAQAKLATFDPMLGYPDNWRDYSSVVISRDTHFANIRAAAKFRVREGYERVGKPVDRTRWGMTVPTSNAYYSPPQNQIVFPAGILRSPMFDLQADDAVNYGAIGVVIGHEISHGFDDSGSRYDELGRLKNWWTDEDRKAFETRATCVVDQFYSYEIEPGVKHNGRLVLGESIGDLGGVSIAYAAFLKSMEGKPRPKDIDGFTPEQRFFVSYAQSRGDSTRIEAQRLMVKTDPHPVARWRVLGPLSNSEPFFKAFGCKDGDKMVRPPAIRCKIW